MDRLRETGEFAPPKLGSLERTLELALNLNKQGRVFADLWDLDQFSDCAVCLARRKERLHSMNLSQAILPAIECPACAGA